MQAPSKTTRKNILSFCFILAFFIVPFIGANLYYHYFSAEQRANPTTNRGQMIQPPLAIANLALKTPAQKPLATESLYGRWTLLYINPAPCEKMCERNLSNMRQIQLAVGKDQKRVARVLVTYANYLSPELSNHLKSTYAGTLALLTHSADLTEFLKPLPSHLSAIPQGYLYIVDPYGNLMMGYAPTANGQDVLKDLERLLKVSQIG